MCEKIRVEINYYNFSQKAIVYYHSSSFLLKFLVKFIYRRYYSIWLSNKYSGFHIDTCIFVSGKTITFSFYAQSLCGEYIH